MFKTSCTQTQTRLATSPLLSCRHRALEDGQFHSRPICPGPGARDDGFMIARANTSANPPSSSSSSEDSNAPKKSFQERLREYGIAGVASYGFLNTLYYITAFSFIWLCVAQVPRGLGMGEAARKFLEVMALTWAGSQVTKVVRAAGALALAPLVDRLLSSLVEKLNLRGKGQAFTVVVLVCLGLAALLFGTVVLLWS